MDRGDVQSVVTGVDGVRVAELEGGAASRESSTRSPSPTPGEPDCNDVQRGVGQILGAERTSLLAQQRADAVAGVLEAVGVTVNAAEGAGSGRDLNGYAEIKVS